MVGRGGGGKLPKVDYMGGLFQKGCCLFQAGGNKGRAFMC